MTVDVGKMWRFRLRRGASRDPAEGACVMDAVSWFHEGRLGDHPACTCPVQAAFLRGANDTLPAGDRQRLRVFIPRLAGTVDRAAEDARADYLARQYATVFLPLALDLGAPEKAEWLREIGRSGRSTSFILSELNHCSSILWSGPLFRITFEICRLLRSGDFECTLGYFYNHLVRACEADLQCRRFLRPMERFTGEVMATIEGVLAIGRRAPDPSRERFQEAVEAFGVAQGRADRRTVPA